MSKPCSEAFRQLADQLGGIDCEAANPVVTVRAPWELNNWTLPVVELLMVGGAALGLAHAIVMLRRHRQPAWLCLWVATIIYLLALEPFLYFPDSFGLGERVGTVFAHNVFSVEFLFDRLPLYIVALYPAGIYLAYVLVDRLGVFRRHGALVGAITVGVVHHAFYEIFDHIGPQLRWWAWNPDAPSSGPFFASVPLTSMVIFAAIAPAVIVALARWLLFRDGEDRSAGSWVWRTFAVGLLTPVVIPVASAPVSIVDPDTNETLATSLYWVYLLVFAAIALWAILGSEPRGSGLTGLAKHYPLIHSAVFLGTFAVLWLVALPDLLDATNGITNDGTPTGSVFYAFGCTTFCAWIVARGVRGQRTDGELSAVLVVGPDVLASDR